jgi:hypothetical protein
MVLLALFAFCTAFFPIFPNSEVLAGNEPDAPVLVGEVKKILPKEGVLVIKPEEGRRQELLLTKETVLRGVLLAEEIEVNQKVKVWYVVEGDTSTAVQIEVRPQLGC